MSEQQVSRLIQDAIADSVSILAALYFAGELTAVQNLVNTIVKQYGTRFATHLIETLQIAIAQNHVQSE